MRADGGLQQALEQHGRVALLLRDGTLPRARDLDDDRAVLVGAAEALVDGSGVEHLGVGRLVPDLNAVLEAADEAVLDGDADGSTADDRDAADDAAHGHAGAVTNREQLTLHGQRIAGEPEQLLVQGRDETVCCHFEFSPWEGGEGVINHNQSLRFAE